MPLANGCFRSGPRLARRIPSSPFQQDTLTPEESDRAPLLFTERPLRLLYRRCMVELSEVGYLPIEEILLQVKHKVLSRQRAFQKMQQEVQAFENFEKLSTRPREPIPADVRMFVWQRDGGECVRCGCAERLDFDHIIPLAKGGSSTERNIQLLCEMCNRAKGSQIEAHDPARRKRASIAIPLMDPVPTAPARVDRDSRPRDDVLDDPDDNRRHNSRRRRLRFVAAVPSSSCDWCNGIADLRSGGADAPPLRST